CRNKDFVIHLAAIIPPLADKKPALSWKVNVEGTRNLIKGIEKYSTNAFLLYSSSISVYGDRLKNPWIKVSDPLRPSEGDEYAKNKIEAEKIIQNSKLDWTIFRLTAIMGGHQISELMFHMPLETPLEIATPEDTARAFVHALNKRKQLSKKIFNLGGGEKCRIIYKDFLKRSFEISGLGKLNFPHKTFAEKNFHCGYYADGDELENILHFRKDTIDTYFEKQKKKTNTIQKFLTGIFKKPILKHLKNKSEPLKAFLSKNNYLIQRFFNYNKFKLFF
ncbi:MAG TPA: NAD(P)-dependent oxidoreductase, partial [Bacteroidetes bacterium]|nr:NAD(P)-dependent oxidoreductase [Bacteroidota bacterium]